MVVAIVALVFVMVGSAVAGTDALTSKLSKSSVKKIARKQINKAAPGLSVSHSTTADNATSATTAGNATTADNATNATTVGNVGVSKVFTKIPNGTGATTAFQGNGLTVTISCAAGHLAINATTSVDHAYIASDNSDGHMTAQIGGDRSSDFGVGDTFNPLSVQARGEGTLTYSQPDGKYVSIVFAADNASTFGTFDGCFIVGTATQG
jgi:hypothetical protein